MCRTLIKEHTRTSTNCSTLSNIRATNTLINIFQECLLTKILGPNNPIRTVDIIPKMASPITVSRFLFSSSVHRYQSYTPIRWCKRRYRACSSKFVNRFHQMTSRLLFKQTNQSWSSQEFIGTQYQIKSVKSTTAEARPTTSAITRSISVARCSSKAAARNSVWATQRS